MKISNLFWLLLLIIGACTDQRKPDSSPAASEDGVIEVRAGKGISILPKLARPSFPTEVILMQDNMHHLSHPAPPLVYRVEGAPFMVTRRPRPSRLAFEGSNVGYIHPALYRRASVRIALTAYSGLPCLAIAHNGLTQRNGALNPSPGLQVCFGTNVTSIEMVKDRSLVAVASDVLPRNVSTEVTVSWDLDLNYVRVDLPSGTFKTPLPAGIQPGGFALRSLSGIPTRFDVYRISAIWQDKRPVVLLDPYSRTLHERSGTALTKNGSLFQLPEVHFSDGTYRNFSEQGYDIRRGKALVTYGAAAAPGVTDPNLFPKFTGDLNTHVGVGVRDLATGYVDMLGHRPGGCLPMQGGVGMDGLGYFTNGGLVLSHGESGLCKVDWNAYAAGRKAEFITKFLSRTNVEVENGHPVAYWGYSDPSSALDGSLLRYVTVHVWNNQVNGLHSNLMISAPPELEPYVALPYYSLPTTQASSDNWQISQTGNHGNPAAFAVRDYQRLWFEDWQYRHTYNPAVPSSISTYNLHTRNRGFNLFVDPTAGNDWASTEYYRSPTDYYDYANHAPDLINASMVISASHFWRPGLPPGEQYNTVFLNKRWLNTINHGFQDYGEVVTPAFTKCEYCVQILMDKDNLSSPAEL